MLIVNIRRYDAYAIGIQARERGFKLSPADYNRY